MAITCLSYAQNAAVYTDNRNGTLDGVPFTINFSEQPNSTYLSKIESKNLNIWDYRGHHLGNPVDVFSFPYFVASNLSVNFDQPIEHLKLYLYATRPVELQFNHPFKLVDNLGRNVTDVSANGVNQINVTYPGYHIVEFTEPVTTLIFTPVSVPGAGYQAITFDGGASILGLDDRFAKARNLKLYPSPASGFIQVSGLTGKENYSIYNVIGTEVGAGTISENTEIEVANLVNGMYFLKLESGNTIKFIKK
ncbi:T9SS type A sorting domain-containing protein [Pseudotamlana haliotis]|uniref:T9SS type A sorting domain-containing protein n=1 Tax=Pseudotamlana haliotis TaxID=2614804 RepID=UPI00177BD242|nr:T9SS type A sorting domain-containing protein [Tamlana haliotis]